MKDELGSLLKMLDAAGFFSVNDDMVDWVLLLLVKLLLLLFFFQTCLPLTSI
jgi:hypothetical protein